MHYHISFKVITIFLKYPKVLYIGACGKLLIAQNWRKRGQNELPQWVLCAHYRFKMVTVFFSKFVQKCPWCFVIKARNPEVLKSISYCFLLENVLCPQFGVKSPRMDPSMGLFFLSQSLFFRFPLFLRIRYKTVKYNQAFFWNSCSPRIGQREQKCVKMAFLSFFMGLLDFFNLFHNSWE